MISISYTKGCRNCGKTNGIENIRNYMNPDEGSFMDKTEFELSQFLENWDKEDGYTCEFCDSNNMEYNDVHIDDFLISDFERLKSECIQNKYEMLIIKATKEYGQINLNYGGSKKISKTGVWSIYDKIFDTLQSISESKYLQKNNANFFMVLTYGLNPKTGNTETRVHTLSFYGFLLDEIEDAISEFINFEQLERE